MADEKDLDGEENAGGGKKKLIIIIAGAVLLLLIGVGAALFLLGGDDDSDAGATAEEAEPVVLPDPIYYKFDPQFVVSLPPGGPAGMLQVSLQVMTRQQQVIDYLKANDPMLRHELFDLLSEQDAKALYSRAGREALAKAIEDRLEAILKEKLDPTTAEDEKPLVSDVEAVYFNELVLQ